MKVLIVGAGVIGVTYGFMLGRGGHDVTHLVRAGRAARFDTPLPVDVLYREENRFHRFRGTHVLNVLETIVDPDRFDLVIFPGHHYTMGEILSDLVPRFPHTPFLFLTQNWTGTGEIDAVLGKDQYLLGDAKAGGAWQNGKLVSAIHSVDLGPGDGGALDLAEWVKGWFEAAGLETVVHTDMVHYLWVQFAITGGLSPALIAAGSFKALFRDRALREASLTAVGECFNLVARRGVDVAAYPEARQLLERSWLKDKLLTLMLWWQFTFSEFGKRTSADALGNPRETKAFYYDILSMAQRLEVPMPVFSSFRPAIDAFAASVREG